MDSLRTQLHEPFIFTSLVDLDLISLDEDNKYSVMEIPRIPCNGYAIIKCYHQQSHNSLISVALVG